MGMTARTLLVILGIFFLLIPSVGQEIPEPTVYSDVVFSYSLREFSQILQSGNDTSLRTDVLYLLGGTVTSITVLDPNPEIYYVDIEILDARWVTTSQLESYEAYLVILDHSFAERISSSQNAPGDLLKPQIRGLFLLEYYGPTETVTGELAPVFILRDFTIL